MAQLPGFNIRNMWGTDTAQVLTKQIPFPRRNTRHRLPVFGNDPSLGYGLRRGEFGLRSRITQLDGSIKALPNTYYPSGGDPYSANVETLLHFDGSDTSEIIG